MRIDKSRDFETFGKRHPISVKLGAEELAAIRKAAADTSTPITRWMREAILARLNQTNGNGSAPADAKKLAV